MKTNRMTIDTPGLLAGICFMLVAALAWYLTGELETGTRREMGAGYFPRLIAILLAVIGALVISRSFSRAVSLPFEFRARPMLAVLGAMLFCATMLKGAGLFVTAFGTVFIASLAISQKFWLRVIPALVLAAFVSLVFVTGLGLPVTILPKGMF